MWPQKMAKEINEGWDDVYNEERRYDDLHQYCNICGHVTKRDKKGDDCPYHQEVLYGEEGAYLKYDEFDQDGNAY